MYFNTKEIGARIQKLRQERHLTQEQLAEQLHISLVHLGKVEVGKHGCSIDLLTDFAVYFDVSVDYLIFGYEHQSQRAKELLVEISRVLDELLQIMR